MGLIRDAFRVFGKVREQQVRDKYVKCGITRRNAAKPGNCLATGSIVCTAWACRDTDEPIPTDLELAMYLVRHGVQRLAEIKPMPD